ncbi:hypothetical protein FQN54_004925 [Arachnomyces sp. PD_36]|nr:hypothetical protein FQN54_004925 [Arachnomyces sp. PD_36]
MDATPCRHPSNPLLLPEIVTYVIDNVDTVPDLLNCACVNNLWSVTALKRLYKGSMHDMQFRTPDIGSLNSLLVASRERFARNMSWVKHLVIAPEKPFRDEDHYFELYRSQSIEKCRAMRHRQYAELLLRPRGGRSLSSLAIPFQIRDQDLSHISDLLLPPTVEFLVIDGSYCEDLMSGCSYPQQQGRFSNLKALTVYRSYVERAMEELFRLLRSCDLLFFHFEEKIWSDTDGTALRDVKELMSCLEQHRNLRALAPMLCRSYGGTSYYRPEVFPWTRLKALYLNGGDKYWLDQIPKLEELEIFRLQHPSMIPNFTWYATERIAKCRHLRAVEIWLPEASRPDGGVLLDIARGCPHLRELSVCHSHVLYYPGLDMTQDLFSDLLRALPFLEMLKFDWKFSLGSARLLEDLNRHGQRLVALELTRARLCVSPPLMMNAPPARKLKIMDFLETLFHDPRRWVRQDKLDYLAVAWRRLFPGVRVVPCSPEPGRPGTIPYSQEAETMSEDESEGEEEGEDADVVGDETNLGDDNSDQSILRTKLWELLGYRRGRRGSFLCDKFRSKWQANLEIEIVGWPVVPSDAFGKPPL